MIPDTPEPLLFGGLSSGFGGEPSMVGTLDEVAFFDRTLSPSEVEAHYLAGLMP